MIKLGRILRCLILLKNFYFVCSVIYYEYIFYTTNVYFISKYMYIGNTFKLYTERVEISKVWTSLL